MGKLRCIKFKESDVSRLAGIVAAELCICAGLSCGIFQTVNINQRDFKLDAMVSAIAGTVMNENITAQIKNTEKKMESSAKSKIQKADAKRKEAESQKEATATQDTKAETSGSTGTRKTTNGTKTSTGAKSSQTDSSANNNSKKEENNKQETNKEESNNSTDKNDFHRFDIWPGNGHHKFDFPSGKPGKWKKTQYGKGYDDRSTQ